MVASDHQLASDAGARIMKQGGNAVDAAIATALALAVVHPSAGNVGGGGFLVYCDGQGLATTYDFRETAPAAATERMFLDEHGAVRDTSNHVGPLAVGTPGTVAGLWLAHQRHGRLPWAALVQPAIDLALGGFPLSPGMSDWCDRLAKTTSPLYAATRAAFLDTDGRPLLPGTTLRQPDLAATLTRIRDHGRDGFYKGETARLLAAFMRDHGGLITEADLAAYQAVERDPVRGTYRGYDIIGMGPPSSGGTAIIEMLNMLEGEDVAKLQTGTAPYLHLLSEVMRRAYADRAQFMGDPDFNDAIPLERLLSKAHAAKLRATIDPARATPSDSSRFGAAWLPHESEQTTHLSVVDAAGGAVSLTYTLEGGPRQADAFEHVAGHRHARRRARAGDRQPRRPHHHQHRAAGDAERDRPRPGHPRRRRSPAHPPPVAARRDAVRGARLCARGTQAARGDGPCAAQAAGAGVRDGDRRRPGHRLAERGGGFAVGGGRGGRLLSGAGVSPAGGARRRCAPCRPRSSRRRRPGA
jgi:gamma-glutamyltranspeptidase